MKKEICLLVGHFEVNKYIERIFMFSSNSLSKVENQKLNLYDVGDWLKI